MLRLPIRVFATVTLLLGAGTLALAQAPVLGSPSLPAQGFQPVPAVPSADAVPAAAPAKPRPRRVARPATTRETSINAEDRRPTLTPDTLPSTALASERYLDIVRAGGWPSLPKGTNLKEGSKGAAVITLKRRLAITGDFEGEMAGDVFDGSLGAAVRRFQFRHGLRQTGIVAGRTLDEMNVSAQTRFRQLASSAQRIAGSTFAFGQRYVVVNIPSAHVETVENGVVSRRYVAIVGRPDRASPTVETRITAVNLNPNWTLPPTIIKEDIIPGMQKGRNVLAQKGVKVFAGGQEIPASSIDWSSARALNYTYRQEPGPRNALGRDRAMRWVWCASTCQTAMRCSCMTRRLATCSAAISASTRRAACACRMCAIWHPGCWMARAVAGTARPLMPASPRASARTSALPAPCRWPGST
ncbi:MAG: L,D-transpeptidase family protein [Beijerinckiaceae bacterium]|nr:L,D-transpeptidase family protein [Beijerinckiaceae bacterium]